MVDSSEQSGPIIFQRRFWPMWSAFTLGAFADNMLRQALLIGVPFGAIALPGLSPEIGVPIIGALFALAMLTFSSIAGQVADKNETAIMLRRTKFIEVCIMATAALGFLLNSGHLLILALFAMGAQSAFFSPVRIGAMPKYFKPEELIRANALFSAGLFVFILTGITLGGMLVVQSAGRTKVAGFLFFAALAGWLFSRKAPPAAATAPDLSLDWNIFRQGAKVFQFALNARGVIRPMLGFGLFYYISTLVTVLVTVYAPQSLGADSSVTNSIMALFTFGAGIGAVSASALAKGRSGLGFSTVGVAAAGCVSVLIFSLTAPVAAAGPHTLASFFSAPAGVALAACFVVCAGCMGLYIVPLQAAMQRRAPAAQRARIMAASNMLNALAAMMGSLSVLVVTTTSIAPETALLAVAVIQLAIALYMFRRKRMVEPGLFDEMLEKNPDATR